MKEYKHHGLHNYITYNQLTYQTSLLTYMINSTLTSYLPSFFLHSVSEKKVQEYNYIYTMSLIRLLVCKYYINLLSNDGVTMVTIPPKKLMLPGYYFKKQAWTI